MLLLCFCDTLLFYAQFLNIDRNLFHSNLEIIMLFYLYLQECNTKHSQWYSLQQPATGWRPFDSRAWEWQQFGTCSTHPWLQVLAYIWPWHWAGHYFTVGWDYNLHILVIGHTLVISCVYYSIIFIIFRSKLPAWFCKYTEIC